MFIPRVEIRRDWVEAGAENPKSERQARGGVAFVISMLDYHPKRKAKVNFGVNSKS